jgi:tRNA-specific 2-thiouridylase
MARTLPVLVAMSGGVDSSVAAALLQRQGRAVVGVTLRLTPDDDGTAAERAGAVAEHLGVEHHVLDVSEVFDREVIAPFCDDYLAGRTPNPCVRCNAKVKLGALLESAIGRQAEQIATGHYARTGYTADGRLALLRSADAAKDQSYGLHRLSQSQLARALFPLGAWTKAQVRQLASEMGLPPTRPESQDICFLRAPYGRFVLERTCQQARPGPIVDTSGRVLGEHKGIVHYTVGQRRGLGIGRDRPLYVVHVDAGRNTLVVGDDADLFGRELAATDVSWIAGEPPAAEFAAEVAIRYTAPAAPASVRVEGERVVVTFRERQRGITPGQAAVFYQAEVVLGGGVIQRRLDLALPSL